MVAGAAAVRQLLSDKSGESAFTQAVALLKAAGAADKAGRGCEGTLMYLAAADKQRDVDADPKETKKKKAGLGKKMPAVDQRVAGVLKDSRALFSELDEDDSGTIDEAEFEKLMGKMMLGVEPGQFAAIDKDGSVRPPLLLTLVISLCSSAFFLSRALEGFSSDIRGRLRKGGD